MKFPATTVVQLEPTVSSVRSRFARPVPSKPTIATAPPRDQTLVNSNGQAVASNDNWKNTQQAAIQATGLAPPNDLESAVVVSLAPGNYTAIVSGQGGGTGDGLVEVYKLP